MKASSEITDWKARRGWRMLSARDVKNKGVCHRQAADRSGPLTGPLVCIAGRSRSASRGRAARPKLMDHLVVIGAILQARVLTRKADRRELGSLLTEVAQNHGAPLAVGKVRAVDHREIEETNFELR